MLTNKDIKRIKQAFKVVSKNPKYSWMIGSDVLLNRDDYLQEIVTRIIEDKRNEKILSSEEYLYTYVLGLFKWIYRDTTQGEKREGMLDNNYLSDMTEQELDSLSLSVNNDKQVIALVRDTLEILEQDIDKRDVEMLTYYYVLGYTHEELSEKFGYKNKSGSKNTLDRVVDKIAPQFKKYFEDFREVDRMWTV